MTTQPLHTVAAHIAALSEAIRNCRESRNVEWLAKHTAKLDKLCYNYLPSGSGWDNGTQLVGANERLIVLAGAFHHMDEHGGYDGWTDHSVSVRATFSGLTVVISGYDRNGVKDYLADVFHAALSRVLTAEEVAELSK